jgi:multiple sugar transport system permease protein
VGDLRRTPAGFLYAAPALAVLGLVLFSPAFYGLWFSLFRIEYGAPTTFFGAGNYLRLLSDPTLGSTLVRTLVHTSASVVGTIVIALALAVWINRLKARTAFAVQMIVIVPWIVSAVVAALLFRWVFVNDIGLAGAVLRSFGIDHFQPLNSPGSAMALLVTVSIWKRIGYAMLVILAGLKSIPGDYEEAALVDGASPWQFFRYIVVPLLKTPLLLVAIVLTLSNINTVETPLITTGGGPADATRILAIDVYERAFTNFDLGTATALAILMLAGNVLLVLAYVRLTQWKV